MKTVFLKNYMVEKLLGTGNTGDVYLALNTALNKRIALKQLKTPPLLLDSQRIQWRADLFESFNRFTGWDHPNIIKYNSIFEEDGSFYLDMEILSGETMAESLKKGHPPVEDMNSAILIYLKTAQALDFAHSEGICHNYLKPSNIFIMKNGHVKVLDFGSSQLNLMVEKKEMGEKIPPRTIEYFSPEQISGGKTGHASDIFALGVTMYQFLTGQYPFKGDNREALKEAILNDTPTPPGIINPNIPERLQEIIAVSMEKDPIMRFESARELLDYLKKLYSSQKNSKASVRAGFFSKLKSNAIHCVRGFGNRTRKAVEDAVKTGTTIYQSVTRKEEEDNESIAPANTAPVELFASLKKPEKKCPEGEEN